MPAALQAVDDAAPPAGTRQKPDQVVGAFTDNYTLGAPPAPLGRTRPSAPLIPPVGIGDNGQPLDLMTSGSIDKDVSTSSAALAAAVTQVAEARAQQQMPAPLPQGWVVQVGAAPTESGANSLLGDASDKIDGLAKFKSFVVQFDKDGQTYFRARFGGFADQAAAIDMCKQLKQAKMSCLAMQS